MRAIVTLAWCFQDHTSIVLLPKDVSLLLSHVRNQGLWSWEKNELTAVWGANSQLLLTSWGTRKAVIVSL